MTKKKLKKQLEKLSKDNNRFADQIDILIDKPQSLEAISIIQSHKTMKLLERVLFAGHVEVECPKKRFSGIYHTYEKR